jgi:hypothetical protein
MSDDPFIDDAFFRCGLINSLAHAHALEHPNVDAIIYEDEYVLVEYKGGECIMTGKPIRSPFQYVIVKESSS